MRKLNQRRHSLSELAEDNSADAKESDGDKDVGGDARLQPRGSDHLQHGSLVQATHYDNEKKRKEHRSRVLNPSVTDIWDLAFLRRFFNSREDQFSLWSLQQGKNF